MATQLQMRRGTTSQVAAFTGANGEVVVDTQKKTIFVNDGATAGGFEIARADFSNIAATATLTLATLTATTLNGTLATAAQANITSVGTLTGFTSTGIDDNASSTAMTIDSSQNVTIAGDLTGTGDTKFLATGDIGIGPRQGSATTGAVYIGGDTDNPFVSPTAIFTGDGKVGVGTATPTTPLDVVSDSSANGIQMRGRSADNIGQFTFESNDSATTYAQIQSLSSELKIKTIANIPMSFHTNNTLAMTINSAGQVTIGSASHADDVLYLARSGTGKILRFYSSGAEVGYISSNTYSLPSDRNFKKDIEDLTLGLDFVNDLKPKQYRQKIEDSDVPLQTGLIAQEVEESLTAAGVSKNKYMMLQHTPDEDENASQYGIDYSKIIPVLINAIQEQQTLIESLQSEVNALKEA